MVPIRWTSLVKKKKKSQKFLRISELQGKEILRISGEMDDLTFSETHEGTQAMNALEQDRCDWERLLRF